MPAPVRDVGAAIRRRDRAFAAITRRHGSPPTRRALPVAQRFSLLATAILHQQLAGAAAAAILGRVVEVAGDPITAEGLVAAGDDRLASCGVSGPKRRSLFDLVDHTLSGELDFATLGRRGDAEVIDTLTTVRGVGVWTAQMFCISGLGRADVWPAGDYGVRAGWTLLHGGGELIAAKDLEGAGAILSPHRSAAAWYCWRAVEDEREGARSTDK